MAYTRNLNNRNLNFAGKYNSYQNSYSAGTNGLTGFQAWECYMLLKYGHADSYGLAGDSEYLIELPLYPEEVTESISATWSKQNILGRSSALAAYANTELKNVNFSLDLHRDFLTGSFSHTAKTLSDIGGNLANQAAGYQRQSDKGPFDTRTWYININKMLQMSCYPQYTTAGLMPPTTYFIFGQMILKGFVESYSTTWKKPIINTFYGWNSVTIQMSCYPDSIISASDMISGTGATSTQNTYNTLYPANKALNSNVMTRTFRKDDRERSNARTNSALYGGTPGGQVIDT